MALFKFNFKSKKNNNETYALADSATDESMIGDKLNFASTEAYKLLRTNLMFSFPDEHGCKVIGVTSAIRGEGKSLTAINTAYSLAAANKKVLLIDADLRLPSVSKKSGLRMSPGLSNLLVSTNKMADTLQHYAFKSTSVSFDVIASGDIPPNPSELLGSERMSILIRELTQYFEYIILDLPPIIDVSDALVVSRIVSGIIIVVRQNYTQRHLLSEAIKQLEFVNAKILGFVFNGATETTTAYGKTYGKYGRYYKKKYSSYYAKGEAEEGGE